jgi:hypothetical protein
LASSPANTVERAPTGYQPLVEKPGRETALSSLTLLDDWIRNPGIAVETPAPAGRASAAAGSGADWRVAARAIPAAATSAAAAVTLTVRTISRGGGFPSIATCLHFIRQIA